MHIHSAYSLLYGGMVFDYMVKTDKTKIQEFAKAYFEAMDKEQYRDIAQCRKPNYMVNSTEFVQDYFKAIADEQERPRSFNVDPLLKKHIALIAKNFFLDQQEQEHVSKFLMWKNSIVLDGLQINIDSRIFSIASIFEPDQKKEDEIKEDSQEIRLNPVVPKSLETELAGLATHLQEKCDNYEQYRLGSYINLEKLNKELAELTTSDNIRGKQARLRTLLNQLQRLENANDKQYAEITEWIAASEFGFADLQAVESYRRTLPHQTEYYGEPKETEVQKFLIYSYKIRQKRDREGTLKKLKTMQAAIPSRYKSQPANRGFLNRMREKIQGLGSSIKSIFSSLWNWLQQLFS